MIKNYFKTAFRNLLQNKVYSFINIAGLSLGLACVMLIILYVKDEVSYDRFHKNAGQVFQVVRKLVNNDGSYFASDAYTGYPQGPGFATSIPEINGFTRLQNGQRDMKKGTDVQSQPVLYVDSNFLSIFSFPLLEGNPKTALLQRHSIVITEEMAKKQFGNASALDKIIMLKGDAEFEPYVVTGVAKNCLQNSTIKFNVLLPIQVSDKDIASEAWLNVFLHTFVVLNANANRQQVEAKMKKVYEANAGVVYKAAREKYDIKWSPQYLLQPLADMHLSKNYEAIDGLSDASNPVFSYILVSIAVLILLIACINFVNLTIARSVRRAKEIGIRKVAGGSRKQLIGQFLGESFLVCLLAFASAIVLVQVLLPLFNQLSNKALALSYLADAKLITGYIGLFFVTGLLAGFYPALVLSNYNPVKTLYSRFRLSGKNRLHKSLVILQFTLASFLIIATLTISSQFNYLTTINLGYDDANLVEIYKWGITPAEAKLFKEQLAGGAGITGVTIKDMGWENEQAKVDGAAPIPLVRETVDENYIPLLKIPVISGRNFSKDFPSDAENAVLVNETFVKRAGWKDAIGKEINLGINGAEKYHVIGVVKDYHFQPLNEVIKPLVFTLKGGRVLGNLFVKINAANKTASLQQIEKAFKAVFPLTSYYYTFKDQENLRNYEAEANWKHIILFAAILTIFISCIGLFGLSVLSAEKRTKEIGVRKVLGASATAVVRILSGDFLRLIITALLVAVPVAWIAAFKWLQNYPYRVQLDWKLFAFASILVICIAMLTVSFQAIKAALANPVKSLRSE